MVARTRLNDCSMKHYIVLNIALFSHAHVTITPKSIWRMRVRALRRHEATAIADFALLSAWRLGIGKLFFEGLGYANNVILSYYPNT